VAERKPYTKGEFNRALVLNALLDPFNIAVLAVLLVVGILLGVLPILGPAAAVLYLAGAARTYFDTDVADRVLADQRASRRKTLEDGRRRLDERKLAPPIARLVHESRVREQRIRTAIAEADLPYAEVADEVDRFVGAMEDTARRAQLLSDALADTPPEQVQERLAQVQGDPEKAELTEALTTQRTTLERMQRQLRRFGTEMERILVELDTIRGQIVSVSASAGASKGQVLASEVRALRQQMGAVADGMAEAYEQQATPET
jgi:chromosome segregation ATPase